jgi:hypothetical protein
MNTNITEIKNEIVNENIKPDPCLLASAEMDARALPAPPTSAPPHAAASTLDIGHEALGPSLPGLLDSNIDFSKARPGKRPRTGKIARLPDNLIEWVNYQLFLEVPLGDISETLLLQGYPDVTHQNLSNWKSGGYIEWLLDQQKRQEKRDQLAALASVVSENRNRLGEASLMLVSSQLLDLVSGHDIAPLKAELAKDPMAYLKVVQLLARLNMGRQNAEKSSKSSPGLTTSEPDLRILPEAERDLTGLTDERITQALQRC